MWWACVEGKGSIKNRNRNLKNSVGQIDVSMRLKCLMSCCPTSIASLYIEGTHYFCEKEGFLHMKDQDPNRAPQVRLRTLQISFSSQMLLYRLCGSSCDAVDFYYYINLSLISHLCCMVETCKNGKVKDFMLTSEWILIPEVCFHGRPAPIIIYSMFWIYVLMTARITTTSLQSDKASVAYQLQPFNGKVPNAAATGWPLRLAYK